ETQQVKLSYLGTERLVADVLTKPVEGRQFQPNVDLLVLTEKNGDNHAIPQ
ncbi:unnamed protein product, partial [Allacma fusca]